MAPALSFRPTDFAWFMLPLGVFLCGCGDTSGETSALAPDGSTNWSPPDAGDDAAQDGSKEGGSSCPGSSCIQLGAQCGSVIDACGSILDCGSCPDGLTCGGAGPNQCGAGSCSSKSCAQLEASCGLMSDGCGSVLDCGTCTLPETCGGGGKPNQCGCQPATCAEQGAECGTISDACGGTLDCGSCQHGSCESNHCSCTPTSCSAQGAECGSIPDECGGTLDCGSCPNDWPCNSNQCQEPDCDDKRCGESDDVGGTCMPGSGCCGGMASGFSLARGQGIWACNGTSHLEHQDDGNVVLYQINPAGVLWHSDTAGTESVILILQGDGNLVLYGHSNAVLWHAETPDHDGAVGVLDDNCNFALFDGATPIWATNTTCQ